MGLAKPILMPKLGQTVEESTIVKWNKSEGEQISKGEVIFEIETDKAVLESEAFNEGTLLKIVVPAGKAVPVQSVVGFIGEPGDELPEIKKPPKPKRKTKPAPANSKPTAKRAAASPAPTDTPSAAPAQPARKPVSPRARRICRERLVSPDPIGGTGPNGRVVERDVRAYLEERNYDSIRISAAARNIAADEELNILEIEGSGADGRIVQSDCERAVKEKPQPMSRMREVIAERLTESFRDTPHFFVTVSVDMSDLIAKRKKVKESGSIPVFSVTDHIIFAVVRSLKDFDAVNSMTPDGRNVKWNSRVHLGLAVALEHGLVVPVVRNADNMGPSELHDAAKALVSKARDGKLAPEEMSGSTFTISNMGMLAVDDFTAIINPGEGAILAVASTVKTPVVKDGEIVARDIMKMTLSADHRIIDGATAVNFMNAIKEKLEQ